MKPGIYDMPMSDYLADPCDAPSLNRSTIHRLITRTPAHAWVMHPQLGAREKKPSRRGDFGSAYHAMLLGGRDIHVIQATNPKGEQASDYRTTAAKEERDAAIDAGQIPLLQTEYDAMLPMVEEARLFYERTKIDGDTEQTVIWEEDGIWFRIRPDIIDRERRVIYDAKSAKDADPFTWVRRTIYPGGYDIQAGLYTRGLQRVTGEPWSFVFLPQEIEEPYGVARVLAGDTMIHLANLKIDRAKTIWRECLTRDEWPRYGYGDHVANAPQYEEHEWEAREEMRGERPEWLGMFVGDDDGA